MSYLKALYDTYETCEKENFVDNSSSPLKILPLYHASYISDGFNIIKLNINGEGDIRTANFIADGETIVFPATEDSLSRSGKYPPPHPLVDKFQYISNQGPEELHKMYIEILGSWRDYANEHDEIPLLNAVYKLANSDNIFETILKKLFSEGEYSFNDDFEVSFQYEEERKGKVNKKNKTIKFKEVFLTFELERGLETVSISNDRKLHKQYIDYVEYQNSKKEQKYCNLTGEKMYCCFKHRGLLGNAKLISVSNNPETYKGRFKDSSDVFTLGYRTSQKIHLMVKALLENKNSTTYLGGNASMVIWFSDDIANDAEVSITVPQGNARNRNVAKVNSPVTTQNKAIGKNLAYGSNRINPNGKFYILILDKLNNGRIAVKYFRSMPNSELIERLDVWIEKHSWDSYNSENKETVYKAPNIFNIINAAYGVEREEKGKNVLKISSDKFRKNLIEDMIISIIDKGRISKGILSSVEENIKCREKYPKTWNSVYYPALAVLRENYKGNTKEVLSQMEETRSFLFGRLLAIYEAIENATYSSEDRRITNAEKLWNAYTNTPESTMFTLDRSTSSYLNKIKNNEGQYGLYRRYSDEKAKVMRELKSKDYYDKDANKPLDYRFIYGYYSEKDDLYKSNKKKEESEVKND